ncbi:M1 family metallopeptidase [Polymorphobacter fuscus]|uniref:Aminopeptidase n=1 Tax=Sandarakinorhabdus fusca TaxID=1439888 RepID=A0A7C9KXD1_9SPHN|nr:M1 family metallopeptidase [Polymorphobacter fuscus]KAB7647628.1 M1 family metallopeptidase [Polymorphobacter fuscus]MQT16906.1 M1 family peptidase [Polymorphobacter fuscus]NJC09105.1 hypothetical protein [Polymorphobacter fuscus]
MRLFALSVLLASTAALAEGIPLGKLPAGVAPTAYRLDLTVDPAQPTYSGHTEIDADVAAPTSRIYLHGLGLKVASATATAGGRTVAARYSEVDPSGVAQLDFAAPLPAGKVTLKFDYTTGFRTGAEGLFRAKVGEDWYAWTQMEPLDARRMFPGFDEPGFKTPFTVTVTAPSAVKAVANAPETGTSPKGAMTVHRFAPTKPLPTYLVAIGVGPFDIAGATIPANAVRKTPLDFRVIATKGQAPRMATTLTETPKIIAILEDYFQSPYPYEKLDFIASPVQGGAMENAGLILYQDTLILLDPAAPPSQLRRFGVVVAHESAHQWFGDLVTPTWWTDIWLNESFAEWMGNKASNRWRPDLGIAAGELDEAFSAMNTDSLGRGRPIRQTIDRNDQVISAFDSITYLKGAQTVSMFEAFVGPENFRKGVQLHLDRYAYKNATAEDFFASVGEAAGNPDLVPALRTFTDQTGVPLITVADTPKAITLAQSRYVPLGVATDKMARLWSIPVTLSRGEGRAATLLTTPTATLPPLIGTTPALMPNADGAGYYRFSLDQAGWDRLIAAAPTLPGRDAMAFADSLWADFAAGRADFATVMRAAEALAGNPERLAAVLLGNKLYGLRATMLTPAEIPAYRRIMARLYTPRLTTIGFDPAVAMAPGESAETAALRESLLPLVALEARDPAVRKQLVTAVDALLAGNPAALAPAFRSTGLAVAVQDGGRGFIDRLWPVLVKSADPLFRTQASRALGRVEDAATIAHVQQLAMGDDLQSLERTGVLSSLAANPAARDATVAFVSKNFTRVVESFPGFARAGIIGFYNGYCTPADVDRVEALVRPNLAILGGGDLELSQTKERIGQCVALKAARGSQIAAVLAKY